MAISRTTRAAVLAGIVGFALAHPVAQAEDAYPTRPVRMVIPFAAGGPTDIVGRVMGIKMAELLGQTFVIENRTGAGGNIGADAVAKSTNDGYTLLMATVSTHAINPGLYKHMPYDPIRDFIPIGRVGVTPTLLAVTNALPATDFKSLVALIKDNPGKYTFGSSGVGSILHLCGEEFRSMAGNLSMTHVPYRGSAPMDVDWVAGQISMAFDATPTALPLAKSGKIRPIAAGMKQRIKDLPDLPTLDELGLKGFECYTWNVILAPAGTPKPVIAKLNKAINQALEDPKVINALSVAGIDPTPGSTPDQAADFVKTELAKWAPIIAASGAHID
jgi:tripartite-type tricarboxylate transporter receptor subunit TctC